MRVLRDYKYTSILTAAREEFIHKGFKDASMRNIAKSSGVGLSNIYNYFTNKDEIFLAIVKPAKDEIFNFVAEQHTEKHLDVNKISTLTYQEETIEVFILLLEKYKDELRLLLYDSEGSSLKNFRDTFTEHLTNVSQDHMKLVMNRYPNAHTLSPFLMHTLSSFMVNIIGEIITHNLTGQKIRDFFKEYFRYETAGWRELIGI